MDGDPNRLAQSLANTYQPTGAESGWSRVAEYNRVLAYCAEHPQKGSSAVASALELPRGRIRPWVDGDSKPDPVRAIHVADERAWLAPGWEHAPKRALNVLVAWIFSGGSINERHFVPYFALDETLSESVLSDAIERAGLSYRITRTDDPDRGREAVPDEHASVLGRMLSVLGAPVGQKHERTALSLPSYLWDAPEPIRLDFARTYLLNRGHTRRDRPEMPVQIGESRSDRFREELVALLRSLVDEPAGIRPSGERLVYLYPEAADQLFMPPTFGNGSAKPPPDAD
jgi:hypothetical protein